MRTRLPARREYRRVAEDGHPRTVSLDYSWRMGSVLVRAGTRVGNPRCVQHLNCLKHALGAVIHHVVVSQANHVHPRESEGLHRVGSGADHLSRLPRRRIAAVIQRPLLVDECDIGRAERVGHAGENRLWFWPPHTHVPRDCKP